MTKKNVKIKGLDLTGVETDIGKRWEQGTPHHPEAERMARQIGEIDFHLCDDSMCWKFGGDGDNGENLLYALDIIFEARDKNG